MSGTPLYPFWVWFFVFFALVFAFCVITRLRRKHAIHQQLIQTQKLSTVGTLASEIAHEINNPLMSIINLAQLITDREADPETQRLGREIISEGERISHIARKLLDFTRNAQEKHEICPLSTIIKDALSLTESLFKKNDIQLNVIGLDQCLSVNCDPGEIRQILLNLLCNARDALNEKYPESHPCKRIDIELSKVQESACLAVRDFGPGIPTHILPHIFKPFYTTKPQQSGTGLGLAISKNILVKHGGSIHLTSKPDKGTCFTILLPLAKRNLNL